MDIYLRLVEEEDAKILFDWRSDPTTRQFSRNTGELHFESHLSWLRESLGNPERVMFMAVDARGSRLGQVRFDRDGRAAEIDIAVSPTMRGRGIGTTMLTKGCEKYLHDFDVDSLLAEIKADNAASIKMFEKAGFEVYEERDDMVRMRLCR